MTRESWCDPFEARCQRCKTLISVRYLLVGPDGLYLCVAAGACEQRQKYNERAVGRRQPRTKAKS